MPITKSAKKARRQSIRRKATNLLAKNKMKALLKQVKGLVAAKKVEEARRLIPQMYQALDKAAKIGVIKKNTAARRKSRMTRLLEKVGAKEK